LKELCESCEGHQVTRYTIVFMDKQLLLGTRNPARIQMVRQILEKTDILVYTLDDLEIYYEVEEDGSSTEINARKKAQQYYTIAKIPTLAMDGGLHIDRLPLDLQPGLMVKRLPGIASPTDQDIQAYYIKLLEGVGGTSPGTWTGSHVLCFSADRVIVYNFTFTVLFTKDPYGDPLPGRALDSLMIDPQRGKYYTELAFEDLPYYGLTRDFLFEYLI
jgi:inosine/xanthosine triphosphate pyrophosphatase family protein